MHGGWGSWGSWGYCPVTCGGGTRYRYRSCNNPTPMYGGNICYGSSSDSVYCNTNGCPGKVLSVTCKEAEKTHWVVVHISGQSCSVDKQHVQIHHGVNQGFEWWELGTMYLTSVRGVHVPITSFVRSQNGSRIVIYYAMWHKNGNPLNCTLQARSIVWGVEMDGGGRGGEGGAAPTFCRIKQFSWIDI